MISAINEVETAVQAMKHGAYHYITKDFDYDELRSLVRNACERQDLNRQVITLSAQVAEQSEREFLIGPSAADPRHRRSGPAGGEAVGDGVDPRRERDRQGATGRLLHKESGQGPSPFIAVNMSAIPHELVESTLFGHERGAFTGAVKQQLGNRAGRRRDAVSRRDRRPAVRSAGQAPARDPGGEIERVGGTGRSAPTSASWRRRTSTSNRR